MNTLTKTLGTLIIAASVSAVATVTFAQSTNGNGNGNGGRGGSSGAGPSGECDNNNALKVRIDTRNPNYPRPRRPRVEISAFKPLSQRDPCHAAYNMITTQNMLVTVPRYNDCVRRHGNNK